MQFGTELTRAAGKHRVGLPHINLAPHRLDEQFPRAEQSAGLDDTASRGDLLRAPGREV